MTRTIEQVMADHDHGGHDDPAIIAAQLEAQLCTEASQLSRLIEDLDVALAACPPEHRQRCGAAHEKMTEAAERLEEVITGRPSVA